MKTIRINNGDLGDGACIDTYNLFTTESYEEMEISYYNEEHGTDYGYDDFEWTYDHEGIVKGLAEARAKVLTRDVDCIESVEVIKTGSPAYYNFSTDWFVADYTIDTDKLDQEIEKHKEAWELYYKEHWATVVENNQDDIKREEDLLVAKLDFIINKVVYGESGFPEENIIWAMDDYVTEVFSENITMELKEKNDAK